MHDADDEFAKLLAELQSARAGRTSLPGKDSPSKTPGEEYAEEKVAQVLFDLEFELNDHNRMLATWIVVTCIGWGIVLARAFLSIPTPAELAFSVLCFVSTLAFIAARIHSYFIGKRLARKQKFIANRGLDSKIALAANSFGAIKAHSLRLLRILEKKRKQLVGHNPPGE